ncbi:Hypothetical_protein [Hexamita inflata]|uniref:Hypothetical_protein n=1 Tax=Hexamita inflata TaxID=28002 RepID=A0AA86P669_9EUKA|nr:Hypothetical protein HINF_LOCUS19880 [Hexamita inflata]CAI9966258.1 Hypothetical protein HINF_LOCUS53903 [Hexamita inflata]
MANNQEILVKFSDQINIINSDVTSLMILCATYFQMNTDIVVTNIIQQLIDQQAGMQSRQKLCALQLYLNSHFQLKLPIQYIIMILEKEHQLLQFNSMPPFQNYLKLRKFQYLNEIKYIQALGISEAILLTILGDDILYSAFKFIAPQQRRNTRFSTIYIQCIPSKVVRILFKFYSFSLSHDVFFLRKLVEQWRGISILPIERCLKDNFNTLRGFSCLDFALNVLREDKQSVFWYWKIKQQDYFQKPINILLPFMDIDIFERKGDNYENLSQILNDEWQTEYLDEPVQEPFKL